MTHSEDIANGLLQPFDLDDEHRAALAKRLLQVIDLVDLQKADKAFKRPQSDSDSLDSLKKALTRTHACIDKLGPATFRKVNRQLVEGDISLLDEISARASAGRTSAPQHIAKVLYHLTGAMLEHLETIERGESARGPHGDFSRFLAVELAYIYAHAAQQLPTRHVDRSSGKQCGPFHAFVSSFLVVTGTHRPGADRIVDLATDTRSDTRPIRII